MNFEETQSLQVHIEAISNILYQNTEPEKLKTLEDIEQVVRQQVLKHVSPEIGVFLFKQLQVQTQGEKDD